VAATIPTRDDAAGLDAIDPLAAFRDHFPVEDGPIYLNGNSLGPPSRTAAAELGALVEEWGRRLVGGWPDWIDLPGRVGDLLGRHVLGAGAGQVVVADSTTVNLYKLAAAALAARPERPFVVGDQDDFPTDRYVLQGLAQAGGRELRTIPSDDPVALADAVDEGVALVCLSHVHFRSAARHDLAAVSALAHAAGALVLWDLSHSAGALPVGLDDAGVDLAVGCTYKYLNAGPGAPAFLYVRGGLQSEIRQPIWGWFGQRQQFAMGREYEPEADVRRFLSGTPPVFGLAAVGGAVAVHAEAGIDRLWAKSVALTGLLIDLHDAWLVPLGCRLGTDRDPGRRGAHVAIRHADAYRLSRALIDGGLVVVDFRPPDTVRFAPAPLYTRFVDVWDAMARTRDVLAAGSYQQVDPTPGRIT
jgi:kynureninase